ncbi:UNVERIFIED_CONTAM: hypothetical protein FKN15_023512 [Acipenser sinensis]
MLAAKLLRVCLWVTLSVCGFRGAGRKETVNEPLEMGKYEQLVLRVVRSVYQVRLSRGDGEEQKVWSGIFARLVNAMLVNRVSGTDPGALAGGTKGLSFQCGNRCGLQEWL